ncbi:MAG TPA: gliding motility-associated C-terminal domain-containing protein [Ferruginibacter sp.]|nr:gliding motility-associated C-terminal domain-containing protein [Ferruginibacter sp.]
MKKNALATICLVTAFFFVDSNVATAQNVVDALQKTNNNNSPKLKVRQNNFTSFTASYKTPNEKWLANNKTYTDHPDAGFITTNDPGPNAIEIISKRTSDSRYFIDADTTSKFYIIKASDAINYEKNGQWLSIDKRLMPTKTKGIFEASHQQEPVGFDINKKAAYIKTFHGTVYFNQWQLIGENKDGQTVLARADWSNLSAGDDGIKITNIFPGINAEMIVEKGSIETNFVISKDQFPAYQRLIFTDEYTTDIPGKLLLKEAQNDIDLSVDKKTIVHIKKAVMYAEKDPAAMYQSLVYKTGQNHLSVSIDSESLHKILLEGNIIVDPLVSASDSISTASINVTGSYTGCGTPNPAQTCDYGLNVQTPPKATLTRIAFQFGYVTISPLPVADAGIYTKLGSCIEGPISVADTGTNKTESGTGSTEGQWYDLPTLIPCLPAPSCFTQIASVHLLFYNTSCGALAFCTDSYAKAEEAFQVLIEGHTLEIDSTANHAISASVTTICKGSPTTLLSRARYGVPPYTYNWSDGSVGDSIVVSPAATTKYRVTITDQCSNVVDTAITIVVNDPVTPAVVITTPSTTVCQVATATFTATPTNGGTAPAYQWKLNGANVGTNSNTYSNNNWVNGDVVSCVLTSSDTCVTTSIANSNTITLTVITAATPTANITVSQNNFCAGTNVTFTVATTNVGASPTYQWLLNGAPTGSNAATYTTNSLANNDQVSCVVTVSSTGCYLAPDVTSNVITMVVYSLPVISFTDNNIIIAKYDSAQINTSVIGTISSFSWTPTASLIDATNLSPIADPSVSTTYQLSVTTTNNCTDSSDVIVQVYDKIFIPNAFAPDGKNNIFRIPQSIIFTLENFSVYDRWGNRVFMTSDRTKGWDGRIDGQNASAGNYVYVISGSDPRGKVLVKGTVLLLR